MVTGRARKNVGDKATPGMQRPAAPFGNAGLPGPLQEAKGGRLATGHQKRPSEAETDAEKILRTGMVIDVHQIAGIEHLMLIFVRQVDRLKRDIDIVRQPVG